MQPKTEETKKLYVAPEKLPQPSTKKISKIIGQSTMRKSQEQNIIPHWDMTGQD